MPLIPGVYPSDQKEPVGHWYSHPVGGRCPLGARVGDGGCTWQRSPLSHSVYTSELLQLGWDTTPLKELFGLPLPNEHQAPAQTLHNIAILRKAFEAKGLPPCGGGR